MIKLNSHIFVFENCLSSFVVTLKSDNCLFPALETREKLSELNTVQARKTTISSTVFIRLRFQQGNRWESDVTLFFLNRGSLEIQRTVP